MRSGADEAVRFVLDTEVSDIERFKALVQQCVDISQEEPGALLGPVTDWGPAIARS